MNNVIGKFDNEVISHTLGKREKSISISIETCGVGGTLDIGNFSFLFFLIIYESNRIYQKSHHIYRNY